MRHSELVISRRNSKAFIDAESVDISFERRATDNQTVSGGRSPAVQVTLPAQRMRLVSVSMVPNFVREEAAGRVFDESWILVGAPDADVASDDEFEAYGDWWVVEAVDVVRNVHTLAGVSRKGRA